MDLQALLKQLQAILSVIIRVIKLVLKFVNISAAAFALVHVEVVVPLAAQVIVPQVVLLCAELVAAPEDVHQE